MEDQTLLECQSLYKYFGGLGAVQNLDFKVKPGEIFGIAGPNGAGKTTLFNLISGHVPTSKGVIDFAGQHIQGQPPDKICQLGIARTFQIPTVFGSQTVMQNALVGAYFGRKARLMPTLSFDKETLEAAQEAVEFVGLWDKRDVVSKLLPIYDKKRLMVASALATKPKILMLDEPVGGLNPSEIDMLMDLVRQVNKAGLTIIMIEHVMRALLSMANRVLVMHHGEKIFEGPPDELVKDEQVINVYLGHSVPKV